LQQALLLAPQLEERGAKGLPCFTSSLLLLSMIYFLLHLQDVAAFGLQLYSSKALYLTFSLEERH
jgi:hypothetical protein